jgi:hypothetical protein
MATVPASGSTSFTVAFAPTTTGSKTAKLTIANNDSNENTYVINLTGTGTSCINPEKPTITQESSSDFISSTLTSSAAPAGGTYQWFNHGAAIDDATSQRYTTSAMGSYTVRVTVSGGCNATSDPFVIVITDAEETIITGDFIVYPNPTTDWVTLMLGKWQGKKKIVIHESTGRQLTTTETPGEEARLYVGKFAPGAYIVTVSTSNSVGVVKFIKQ